ncbi:MAG TPA: sugar ABC transporter permease [Bacillota bacterium]|nr:sugar ABC transporter permease [Clostridiales bacterium]HPT85610.1 sugar ABC transporter permease [Bacillota bacterium]
MNNASTVKKAPPKQRRKIVSLDKKKARAGWIFVMPFVLGFLIIYLPVIIDSIRYSFNEIKILPGGGYELHFVGFENYQKALFEDPSYVRTLTSGIRQLVFDIPAIVIFSLFMAVLLNQNMFGRAAFRAIFFVPVILSTGLIDQIDRSNVLLSYMGDTSSGIDTGTGRDTVTEIVSVADFSRLFRNMQVGTELLEYVTGYVNQIYNIINRSGVQMLVFLAGLQSISPAIYESCSIDGATAWETFWKITFPMISPLILANTIYTVIDSFTSESNQVMTYIAGVYNEAGGQVVSTAMAWMYFLLVLAIIGVVVAVLSAYVFYQKRDL